MASILGEEYQECLSAKIILIIPDYGFRPELIFK